MFEEITSIDELGGSQAQETNESKSQPVEAQQTADAKAKKKANRKNEQIKNLLVQLYELRVTTKELVERYQVVVSGQLSGLILVLEESQHSLKTNLKLKTNTLRSMSEKLQDLKLKPKKGKAKDLRRIEEIVEKFSSIFVEVES